MTSQMALDLAYRAMMTAAKMAAPALLTAIVIGVVVNIIQTVTSVRDMSLTFVPKVVAVTVVGGFTMPWVFATMTAFFQEMYMGFAMVTP